MPSLSHPARIVCGLTLSGFVMKSKTSTRSPRNIETRKKKARRAIPRSQVTRIQGNTPAVRKRLKKLAGIRRAQVAV
jgi:hypothetical protein